MNAKNSNATLKTLATGLILSGLTLAGLAATGCDKLNAAQIAGLTNAGPTAAQSVADVKPAPCNKWNLAAAIRQNHNESFLLD